MDKGKQKKLLQKNPKKNPLKLLQKNKKTTEKLLRGNAKFIVREPKIVPERKVPPGLCKISLLPRANSLFMMIPFKLIELWKYYSHNHKNNQYGADSLESSLLPQDV